MPRLTWDYPEFLAYRLQWRPAPVGTDLPEDIARQGFAVMAVKETPKGKYVVAVRDGWYWLVRNVPRDQPFDGVRLCQIAKTDVRYHDDDEIR